MTLLDHPFWLEMIPSQMRLVRIFNLPSSINPFADDNVVLKVAAAPGEVPYHKWPMARAGILQGIKEGRVDADTTIVEATSGNTGHAMAAICNKLGRRFVAVIATDDVPDAKIDIIRALGPHVEVAEPKPGETTAQCARRLGQQPGWYNPDQYAGLWNPQSHYDFLAPQLFGQGDISILVTPAGTMGTCLGLARYTRDNGLATRVVPVMCAEGEEVPAVRTLSRVKKDIGHPWPRYFDETRDLEFAGLRESLLLSFLSWQLIPVELGPSFGAAFAGALKFLHKHKAAGTLDQFRRGPGGEIDVVIFGPDDYRPYNALYLEHHLDDANVQEEVDVMELIELG